MRASGLRSTFLFLSLCTLLPLVAVPAQADEGAERAHGDHQAHGVDPRRRAQVLEGLRAGIRALQMLGGHERALHHLEEVLAEVERQHAAAARPRRGAGMRAQEKQAEADRELAQTVEIMRMASRVLAEAERPGHAERLAHAATAMRISAAGHADGWALEVLAGAPSAAAQGESLELAAEILADQGKGRQAHFCRTLARRLGAQTDSPRTKRRPRASEEGDFDLEELADRVRILRMGIPALREGERREAAEVLERAVRSGALLLEGRSDEEAQRVFRQTPSLLEMAEVLHLAARLWLRFEHADEAEAVARLSRYYRERAAGKEKEERETANQQTEEEHRREAARDALQRAERRAEHERRVRAERLRVEEHRHDEHRHEEDKGRTEDADARIDELRRELSEVQQALRQLMRELREMAKDK